MCQRSNDQILEQMSDRTRERTRGLASGRVSRHKIGQKLNTVERRTRTRQRKQVSRVDLHHLQRSLYTVYRPQVTRGRTPLIRWCARLRIPALVTLLIPQLANSSVVEYDQRTVTGELRAEQGAQAVSMRRMAIGMRARLLNARQTPE